nr:hypothetical protein [Odoribacter splanchnicus]
MEKNDRSQLGQAFERQINLEAIVFPGRRRTDKINENLTGSFQANRSDGINPGIGMQ